MGFFSSEGPKEVTLANGDTFYVKQVSAQAISQIGRMSQDKQVPAFVLAGTCDADGKPLKPLTSKNIADMMNEPMAPLLELAMAVMKESGLKDAAQDLAKVLQEEMDDDPFAEQPTP